MASFLRVIRQGRWLRKPDWEWLSPDDIHSDVLGDLQTKENRLSVYRVENELDTDQVVVALAANRDSLAHLDYAVFDHIQLIETRLSICQQEGETPDLQVNKLHYDLTNLTVGKLVQLARVISTSNHVRVTRKQIKEGLKQAVTAGKLDESRVKSKLLDKLS